MEFEALVAVAVLFCLGAFGCIFQIALITLKFKLKSMKNDFYTFVFALAINDLAILLIFMFWCTSCIIFSIPMENYFNTTIPGFAMMLCWHVSAHVLLVISASRLIAVYFPSKFLLITAKQVNRALALTLAVSFITTIPLLIPPCCFFFDYTLYVYHLGSDDCSWYYDKVVSLIYDIGLLLCISLLLNWATFYKVWHRKRTAKVNKQHETKEDKRKRKAEFSFLVQSTVNGCLDVVIVLCFHVVSLHVSTRMGLFFCTTVAWEISHVLNGIIFLLGNGEAQNVILRSLRLKITPSNDHTAAASTTMNNPAYSANTGIRHE